MALHSTFEDIQDRIGSLAIFPPSSDGSVAKPKSAVVPTSSRCEAAMDAIKSYIIGRGLGPGDPLPNEARLCEELGVSRSSVREAVRKLEALHIVRVEHGKGTFVGDLSLEPLVETLSFRAMTGGAKDVSELLEVIQIRRILDLGIAEQVIEAMRGTEQTRLYELIEEMSQCVHDQKRFVQLDIEFHSILQHASGNAVLAQLAKSMWLVHMAVLPQLGLAVSDDLEKSAHAHHDMVIAAIDGDVEAYRAAVIEHYRPIESIVETYLAQGEQSK